MLDPFLERIRQIREFVMDARLGEALRGLYTLMQEVAPDESGRVVPSIAAHTRLERERTDALINSEDYRTELARLARATEVLLRDLERRSSELKKIIPSALIATPKSLVLHLSDLHFGTKEDASLWYSQLAEDIHLELNCTHLDAVILSGDIANFSTPEEYGAAQTFLAEVAAEFHLSPTQMIPIPGNHDLNWDLSKKSYKRVERDEYAGKLEEGRFIDIDNGGLGVRDEALYSKRFTPFAKFYEDLRQEPYPLAANEQGLLYPLPAQRILILGLNSAWNLDHHFKARASIHQEALSHALNRVRHEPAYKDWLKIAVWHHPIHSAFEDRIVDTSFLERLAVAGFQIGLHGHIHKASTSLFRYDLAPAGRRIELLSAGTFGAPVNEWVPGYPLQYQLLRFEGSLLTVETRQREKINGAWKPDARWTMGKGKDPVPRYSITL